MSTTTKLTISILLEVGEFLDNQDRERKQSRTAHRLRMLGKKRKAVFEEELAQPIRADDHHRGYHWAAIPAVHNRPQTSR